MSYRCRSRYRNNICRLYDSSIKKFIFIKCIIKICFFRICINRSIRFVVNYDGIFNIICIIKINFNFEFIY